MKANDYKGVIRDKTTKFFGFKQSGPYQQERFKPKKESLFKNFHDKNSDENEMDQDSLLISPDELMFGNQKNKTDQREKHILPPRWVDQEEQVEENITEIKKQIMILDAEVKKSKHNIFDQNNLSHHKIEKINTEIITLVRQSEQELKEIMSFKIDNNIDDKIRK
jgi:hypothetical protein